MRPALLLLAIVAIACSDRSLGEDDPTLGDTGTSDATLGNSTSSTGDLPPPDETGNDTTGIGFIASPDGATDDYECSQWEQDCPEGQKCAAWSNDGSGVWNAQRCVDVDPNARQIGEPCITEGSPSSGVDNCDLGLMCWDVDPDNLVGTCVSLCQGSEVDPSCTGETACLVANEGALILCLDTCDPLAGECGEGEQCAPLRNSLFCSPGGGDTPVGQPCEFELACEPGLACAPASEVPGCAGPGCCTPFCDLTAPDPDAACPQAGAGQRCLPNFETAPPGLEHLGRCAVP